MKIRCPECEFPVRVSDDDGDVRVKCPECGESFRSSEVDERDEKRNSGTRGSGRRRPTNTTTPLVIIGAVGLLLVGLAVVGGVLLLNKGPNAAETSPAAQAQLGAPSQPLPPPVNPFAPGGGVEFNRPALPPATGYPPTCDLKVPSAKVSSEWGGPRQVREVLPTLTWAADGKAFYALDQGAHVVRRFSFPELNEEAKQTVGQEVSWLSLSKEGVVVTVCGSQEAWVLDPVTLEKRRTFPVGKALRVLTAASLSVGYVCNTEERQNFGDQTAYRPHGGVLRMFDLKTAQQVKEYDVQSLHNKGALYAAVISADGKHLFTMGGQRQLQQYALDGEQVNFVTTSPNLLASADSTQPVVSADGRLVSAPSGGGNMLVKNGRAVIDNNTYVFVPGNLNDPLFDLKIEANPVAVGFDMKAGLIYAQNSKYHLIILDHEGTKLRSCVLVSNRLDARGGDGVRQLLPHPDGGKLLVLVAHGASGNATAFAVELSKK
jgi:hypothetical protein